MFLFVRAATLKLEQTRKKFSKEKLDAGNARRKLLDVMLQYGLSGLDIIKQFQKEIWNLDIEDRKRAFLMDKCGETEFRMTEGSDEFIQLESLLAQFTLAGSKK